MGKYNAGIVCNILFVAEVNINAGYTFILE